ncbi:MAG: hypothetical protein GX639_01510, partial [Fibrobacter sp.]|nr:hypothetical protein [Fibrobacter sp.]
KPSISVSGDTIFKPGDTCVLSITKTDPDTKQLLTTSVKGKPEGSLLKDNKFTWIIPSIFTGRDTILFIVNDNGYPQESDSQTVVITVTSTPHTPLISISGDSIVKPLETCSLTIHTSDKDSGQQLVVTMAGQPEGAVLANDSQFTWTAPNVTSAKHTVTFTVTDNGNPPLSSSVSVTIQVSAESVTQDPTYTVTYVGNGSTSGTVPVDTNKYISGASATVAAAGTLVKTGSTFTGWNTNAAGTGVARAAGTLYPIGAANDTLYAQWTTNPTYTVTYLGNGSTSGTVPVDSNKYIGGASVTVATAGTLVKTGSTFTGWNTNAAGTGIARAAGSAYAIGAVNDTLYAQWTTNPTYSVTYIGNGSTSGSVPVDSNNYLSGASVTVAAAGTLVKTGCTFTGWNTNAAGTGIARAAGSTYAISAANDTLYAQWTQNPTFTVTYIGNGSTSGSVPVDPNKYISGASVTVAAAGTLVKTGSTFAGWNTNAAGTGTARAAASTYEIGAANDTLYAQWTQNPTFTVTYIGNGSTSGSVPVDANRYLSGAPVTVAAAGTLVKTGSTFAGWNTNADGTGTARAAASTYEIGAANDTLYAQWTQNPTFTVTYIGNGSTSGSVPVDANRYLSGASVTVAAAGTLVKTGSTFAGWNTNAAGTGTARVAGSDYAIGAANDTLYAQWTTNPTFTVTYLANNGSGTAPVDSKKYEADSLVTVLEPTSLSRIGYTFIEWNTAAEGGEKSYAAKSTFKMPSENVTLYAQWKIKQYSVTYDDNGASGGTVPSDASLHDSASIVTAMANAGNLVKTGSAFDGWNTAKDGKGTTYIAGTSTFKITANTILYAKWKAKTYTLRYDGNGNTGGDVPDAATYDSNATVTISGNTNGLTKTGFDFNGWNTKANGSGVAMAAASTFKIKSDTTLFAQWIVKKYNLTIEAPVNGTTNPSGIVSVDSAAARSITATPSTGYKFKYWRVVSGTAQIANTASATTTITLTSGNATITAVFTGLTFVKQLQMTQYTGLSIVDVVQADDGSYMLAGELSDDNGILIKLDLDGDTVWTKTFPMESVQSIKKASNCVIITGSNNNNVHAVCFSSQNGNQEWIHSTYSTNQSYSGSVTRMTSDNGYMIAGTTNNDFFLCKLNATRHDVWSFQYNAGGMDALTDCVPTPDGGYMMAGVASMGGKACIIKVNSEGEQQWINYYQDILQSSGRVHTVSSIEVTMDGDCVISVVSAQTNYECYLLKVSQADEGKVSLFKNYPNAFDLASIQPLSDGYFIAGSTTKLGSGLQDIYIAKVNSSGNIIKETTYGTSGAHEYCSDMKLTNDGGCIVVGAGNWVIKTDENGEAK